MEFYLKTTQIGVSAYLSDLHVKKGDSFYAAVEHDYYAGNTPVIFRIFTTELQHIHSLDQSVFTDVELKVGTLLFPTNSTSQFPEFSKGKSQLVGYDVISIQDKTSQVRLSSSFQGLQ
jgi:hypothetical protein